MKSLYGNLALLAVLLLLPVAALYHLDQSTPGVLIEGSLAMALVSCISWKMIAADKQYARKKEWRTPESFLHMAELFGGWPGSLLAQRRYRHKTAKLSYRLKFYSIILLYQIVAFSLI